MKWLCAAVEVCAYKMLVVILTRVSQAIIFPLATYNLSVQISFKGCFISCAYRSGIFHAMKLLHDKFSCKKYFIGTIPLTLTVYNFHS